LLKISSDVLTSMSMGNKMLYPILLLWAVAVFTSVLNAGPATSLFVPIVMHSGYADFTDVVWWAIALGSLAGACASMMGASAGIIAPTIVEELHSARMDDKGRDTLTFASYSRRGIPVALIFLVISSFYIAFLSMVP
jgi:Na+/H+ antiporter NhaD/arsenite permease-like protein